jgi:cytochrome b561
MLSRIRASIIAGKNTLVGKLRKSSSSAGQATDAYSEKYGQGMQVMHWTMAGTILTTVGIVNYAQFFKGKEKMSIMFWHKSFGLLTASLIFPRLFFKFTSKIPPPVPGPAWERFAAQAGHIGLYGFTIFMSATGIAMGYYGGKGLPFFWTTVPGAEKADGEIAKKAFKFHSNFGHYAQYLIPAHVGAVGFHYFFRGRNILPRMLPPAK